MAMPVDERRRKSGESRREGGAGLGRRRRFASLWDRSSRDRLGLLGVSFVPWVVWRPALAQHLLSTRAKLNALTRLRLAFGGGGPPTAMGSTADRCCYIGVDEW